MLVEQIGYIIDSQFSYYERYDVNANGKIVAPHNHSGWCEIMLLKSGKCTFFVEDSKYKMSAGDLIIVNHAEVHSSIIEDDDKFQRIVISFNLKDYLNNTDGFKEISQLFFKREPGHNNLFPEGSIKDFVYLLDEMGEYISKNKSVVILRALFTLFLLKLTEAAQSIDYSEKGVDYCEITLKIVDYIEQNKDKPITLETIADHIFLNKYYISHIFKKNMGVSIGNYIIIRRIMYAQSLIVSGVGLKDVAFMCGYQNYSSFFKAFVKVQKMSPTDFHKTYFK